MTEEILCQTLMIRIQKYRILFFILFLLLIQAGYAQNKYTIAQIPDPKASGNGYVSNPDLILSPAGVDSLNRTITDLEQRTKVEMAVVVVNDFDAGQEEYDFALQLFRQWGIGKSKANNGLLLFIAIDRKQYRFITGYGLEGLLPDAALKRIGDHFLIPAFKEGDYSKGVVNALGTIAAYLNQPGNQKELSQLLPPDPGQRNTWLWTIAGTILVMGLFAAAFFGIRKKTPKISKNKASAKTNAYDKTIGCGCGGLFMILVAAGFIIGFTTGYSWVKSLDVRIIPLLLYLILSIILLARYMNAISVLRKIHQDDLNFSQAVKALNRSSIFYLVASPLILIVMLMEAYRRTQAASRFKPQLDSQNREMSRVDRDQTAPDQTFLTKGQLKEEQLEVNHYDIWLSSDQAAHKIIGYPGSNFADFTVCPTCNAKTLSKEKLVTLKKATYTKEGEGKEVKICENCGYEEFIKSVIIAVRTRSDDSRSSDSGSSSSGSSSSGSSSGWGGGSSGGGGAGGKW